MENLINNSVKNIKSSFDRESKKWILNCTLVVDQFNPDLNTDINNILKTNVNFNINYKTAVSLSDHKPCLNLLYKKAMIDEKYPHWSNVIINGFKIDERLDVERVITIKEKEHFIKAMALGRLVLNIDEFKTEVLNTASTTGFRATRSGVFEGGVWNITQEEAMTKNLDGYRLLETIKEANYSVWYTKYYLQNGAFAGLLGDLSYAFHGYKNFNHGSKVYGFYGDWTSRSISSVTKSLIHEHMHNLGYNHNGDDGGVPYGLGTIVEQLAPRIAGDYESVVPDLYEKYKDMWNELTDFYLEWYSFELKEDTVIKKDSKLLDNESNIVDNSLIVTCY